MSVFSDIIGIEDECNENGEQMYEFEFTVQELEDLKESLRESGLEFCRNRALYKKLCEAVSDDMDKVILTRYE